MKKVLLFAFITLASLSLRAQGVEWLTFEEAVARSEKEPRKLLVDLYTDWCGWCKKMDKDTYANPVIADYINKNFYPVKFNAEQKDPVVFNGHTFKYIASGKRGVHELALALSNNQASYPMTVFLDEKMQIIQPLPGYQNAATFDPIIQYIGSDSFKKTPWKDYQKNFQSSL